MTVHDIDVGSSAGVTYVTYSRRRDEPATGIDLESEGALSDFWAPVNLRDRTMRSMKLTRISGGTAESGTALVSARNSPAVTLSTRGTITPGVSTRYRGGLDAIRKADTWRVTPGMAPTRATFHIRVFLGPGGGERGMQGAKVRNRSAGECRAISADDGKVSGKRPAQVNVRHVSAHSGDTAELSYSI